ncbi:VOC family protein [Rossellomorea vietnamensis]|uniref:VOC family protein n=1 Tax=Rossellomorea aquimaris TaxID=189382 RepID=A0A5D4TAK9_9BACI|nr:VOC family protein [Rossellomorea aquimaris]TYS72667.1 VOC family protein [Rossellomorea aquimaris]
MSGFISHIATLEIPVSSLETAIPFYVEVAGAEVEFKGERNAMLTFGKKGVPTIFLVETEQTNRLFFRNSHNEIEHSIIDFYTADLKGFHNWLKSKDIETGPLNINPKHGYGGFGFKDPDGNHLSATNVLHKGQ